jgi:hypothetical protein
VRHSSWFPVLGPVVMGIVSLRGMKTRGSEDLEMGVSVVGLWFTILSSPRSEEV